MNKTQTLASKVDKILSILKNIIKNEGNPLEPDLSIVGYPVLIGSHAAKWHVPSFREPNDWDLVATSSQSILFIDKIMNNAIFKDIKLIYYLGTGLKIIGECAELSTDENSIKFEVELVSDKVDLRKMRLNEAVDVEDSMDIDDNGGRSGKGKSSNQTNLPPVKSVAENSSNKDGSDSDKESEDGSDKDDKDDGVDVNKIEFEKFNEDQSKMSAQMILELCYDVEDKKLFPLSSFPCIVAPLKILEALKASHIYWAVNFHKNIADLHSLRVLLGNNQVPVTEPLRSPKRDEQIEFMLKTRIKETEILRGVPGAHINLNKTNEEFLDREDDLFVQRKISHDEIHERVKYGDHPIYETLKTDKSKAWIKNSLFKQTDYQTQLNCVKEEAMAIALERYLIPMISKNQETSYSSALVRICTSLTKGWFRQFAIDNYPRLSKLDKDLLSIAHDIIKNHPLPQKKQEEPLALLYKWIPDPDTRAIFEPIHSYTQIISSFDDFDETSFDEFTAERSGLKITSPVNNTSIVAIITTVNSAYLEEMCTPSAAWFASVVILPSEDLAVSSEDEHDGFDPLHLHPYDHTHEKYLELTPKHIFTIEIHAYATSGGSWGIGQDVWRSPRIYVRSADHIANKLEIPGLTGDLLFKYVLAYLQPTLQNNGSTPIKHQIDKLKAEGTIPIKPSQHLWYDTWNYTMKNEEEQKEWGSSYWY